MIANTRESIEARFEMVDGCSIWQGYVNPKGYGTVNFEGTLELIHRLIYTWNYGAIPSALQIDHLCRVRSCANPSHLEAVTCQENILRGEGLAAKNAAKTHCVNGHDLSDSWIRDNGARACRQCNRDAQKRYHQRKAVM